MYIYYIYRHKPAKTATSVPLYFLTGIGRKKCALKILRQLETGFHCRRQWCWEEKLGFPLTSSYPISSLVTSRKYQLVFQLFENGIIFSKKGWGKGQHSFISLEFLDAIFIKMEKNLQLGQHICNPEAFLVIAIVIIQSNSSMCIKKAFCCIFFLLGPGAGIQSTKPQELKHYQVSFHFNHSCNTVTW